MRLSHALLSKGMGHNAIFPTPTGPVGSLKTVLSAILTKLDHHLADPNFEDELANGDALGGEEMWLNNVFWHHGGMLPPFIVARVPHQTARGTRDKDILDLHAFVSQPLKLHETLVIRLNKIEDAKAAQWLVAQDPFGTPLVTYTMVAATLWQKNDPNSALPGMLAMAIANKIRSLLTGEPINHKDQSIWRALKEWHLSIELANENKIGLSATTAKILSLSTLHALDGYGQGHNALDFGVSDLSWKRDFKIITSAGKNAPGTRIAAPVGSFSRLNQHRLAQLPFVARLPKGMQLVDKALQYPRNFAYAEAAEAYANHLDNEVWRAGVNYPGEGPDKDQRPIRPIHWPHVTEVDNTPMATAGQVIVSMASNILETVLILEEPASIITERWAIITGEIPASIAGGLTGRPFTDVVEHPLLDPIGEHGDPDYEASTLVIKEVKSLMEESAGRLFRQLPAEEAAWQALYQAISFGDREMPPFMKVLGAKSNRTANTPVPGCTLILFEQRPILGNTPLGTVTLNRRQAETLKNAIDYSDGIK